MDAVTTAPYGAWKSPIVSELLVKDVVVFYESASDGENFYWTQLVPSQGGRAQLSALSAGGKEVDLAPEMSVRTRVHEYGGGALAAEHGILYFVNDRDGRIYRLDQGKKPVPITPPSKLRLADFCSTADGKTLYAVAEDHQAKEVVNKLVKIDAKGSFQDVAAGHDFYAAPRLSPDGKRLAYVTWDDPDMPWDGSNLWVMELSDQKKAPQLVAGSREESICYPRWSKSGELYFFSDKSGWWNLYRFKNGRVEELYPQQVEFTFPPWGLGRGNYDFTKDGKVVCVYGRNGVDHLALLDPENKQLQEFELPFTVIKNVAVVGSAVYFFGGSPAEPLALIRFDPVSQHYEALKKSTGITLDEKLISIPTPIVFITRHSDKCYGFYYPPKNPNCLAPEGELPPLIIKCHGGPTAHTQPIFSLEIQYWTSRGFAFFDLNYSGSSGYGRDYRNRLNGTWGIREVEDCLDGALFLVDRGLADRKRLLIRGGSAGGFTTLCALTFHDLFAAGASYYGICDLELLVKDTHKFEARYLEKLIAPYPDRRDVYLSRSPIHHIKSLTHPVLILQGSKDPVVPLNQAVEAFDTLKGQNTPVALLVFEGEQHGFRAAENIKRSLEAELYFYAKVLDLPLMDEIKPITIENLP